MVVHLNGNRHEIADCYENLKTRHYQRIISEWDQDKEITERNFFKLFCILADVNFKEFHATAENELTIWNAVKWMIEQPFNFSKEVPKYLKIGGKIVDVPERIELLSIGQNIHLRSEIEKLPCIEAGISMAAAIFLQPEYDSYYESINKAVGADFVKTEVKRLVKFDFEKALKLKALIDEMPAYLIYPIGFFLLQSALPTGKNGTNGSKNPKISLISRLGRTLRGWLSPNGYSHSVT